MKTLIGTKIDRRGDFLKKWWIEAIDKNDLFKQITIANDRLRYLDYKIFFVDDVLEEEYCRWLQPKDKQFYIDLALERGALID